jgi:DNA-binding MltR family transcriptional regulator
MAWYLTNSDDDVAIKLIDAEIERASDRAACIIAGSYVETKLTEYLKSKVNHHKDLWDRLTHPSAPLGSFSVKIDIAFMFALITKEARSDLVILKDVRNAFAHKMTIAGFQDQWVQDKCKNL